MKHAPLKCIAIDDEPLALELIKEYCAKIPELSLTQCFEDAISGAEFLNKNVVNLLFLDINMPDITGIELVKSLKDRPLIIFTTAYKNFAFEGFELDALDYLLKPFEFNRFLKAVQKAIDYFNFKSRSGSSETENLYVHSEYRLVKIPFRDIDYIESLEDYIRIHIEGAKPILTLMPLKKVLEKLPADRFKRIHRSYLVAVSKVKSIQNRKVQLESGVELPVSDSYSNFISEWACN